MRKLFLSSVCLSILLVPPAADAQVQDHDGQFGLRTGIGTGLQYFVSYGEDKTDLSRAPFAVSAAASYGLTSALEVALGGILALEKPGHLSSRPVAATAGVRYFYNPLSFLKFYSTLDGVLPVTPRADFGLRNEDGIQYDFNEYIGLFCGLDLTVLFVADLTTIAGLNAGFQLRI
ncbi:MAG: hypothetical protein HY897_26180 [Deltaproteobacteria bacterium]|nr:hypothetical protein [Deltaproteobacteria bacterium]